MCQVWLKIAQWFWSRRFLKVLNVFISFPNYLPFQKGVTFRLNKLEFPSSKNAVWQDWLKLDQWFWRRRFFKVFNVFYYFTIISPLRRAWSFIWKNLNFFYPSMTCAKFGSNWLSGSGEEDENVKSLHTDIRTDGQTDRRTTYYQKSLIEL